MSYPTVVLCGPPSSKKWGYVRAISRHVNVRLFSLFLQRGDVCIHMCISDTSMQVQRVSFLRSFQMPMPFPLPAAVSAMWCVVWHFSLRQHFCHRHCPANEQWPSRAICQCVLSPSFPHTHIAVALLCYGGKCCIESGAQICNGLPAQFSNKIIDLLFQLIFQFGMLGEVACVFVRFR